MILGQVTVDEPTLLISAACRVQYATVPVDLVMAHTVPVVQYRTVVHACACAGELQYCREIFSLHLVETHMILYTFPSFMYRTQ